MLVSGSPRSRLFFEVWGTRAIRVVLRLLYTAPMKRANGNKRLVLRVSAVLAEWFFLVLGSLNGLAQTVADEREHEKRRRS
jgi:hypothetical protein